MRSVAIGVLLAGTVLLGPSVRAEPTSAGERQMLAQLAGEIDLLERLIIAAEMRAHHDARFAFDYEGLRSRLGDVRQHIDVYLEIDRRQPRKLTSKVEG